MYVFIYIYSYCISKKCGFLLFFCPHNCTFISISLCDFIFHFIFFKKFYFLWPTVTFPVIVTISHYHKFISQKLWIPHKVTSYLTSAPFFSELQLFLIILTFCDLIATFLVIAHLYLRNSDHFSQWRLSSELQLFYIIVTFLRHFLKLQISIS